MTPTHIIGDPCYFLHTIEAGGATNDQLWVDSFCEALENAEMQERFTGHLTYMGHPIFVHSTAYGDGQYEGTDGRSYSVDAGIIGVIPVSLIENEVVQQILNTKIVRAVSMTREQLSKAEYFDGTFTFYTSEGRFEIETDPEEEYFCENCGAEISEYEYHDIEALCRWCIADREEEEREEEDREEDECEEDED